ncbi:Mitochondrial Rho GTPase, partial [Paragonimus heterotremus]
KVGKTTLILSLVSEEFSPKVPAQAEEITIPADVTPERVATQIVDYSARTQSQEQLCAEIRRADVICLVHALDDEKSMEKQVLPIMSEFSEVETCIECSAKTLLNLSEAFWFAQKAVLYPTAPLYDAERKELTPACIRALTRVFRICDTDNDGYLSDRELEAFQSRCFSVPLTTQSLQDVKQLIRQSCPGGVTLNGITQKGFLFLHLIFVQKGRHETTWTVLRQFGYDNQIRLSNDFLYPRFSVPSGCSTEISGLGSQFLQMLFRKYDLDRDGCLSPTEIAELLATCPEDQLPNLSELTDSVTTNSSGWITRQGFMAYWTLTAYLEPTRVLEYFAHLGFTYFAAGSYWSNLGPRGSAQPQPHPGSFNGCLSPRTPTTIGNHVLRDHSSVPYGGTISAGPGNSLIRSDTSLSNSVTHMNAREALLRGLVITTEKRLDAIRRSTQRTVFYCRVYGARKVGKTCLLQGLLGRHLRGSGGLAIGGISGRASCWAAACGIPVYGHHRSFIMHEIGAAAGEQMTAGEALSADVACLVYDVSDPESFRYVANLFLNYYRGTRVPCLFVAAKADQPHAVQNYPVDPGELAVKYNLNPPEPFSSIHFEQQQQQPQQLVSGSTRSSLADSSLSYSDTSLFTRGSRHGRRAGSMEPSSSTSTLTTGDVRLADGHQSVGLGLIGATGNRTDSAEPSPSSRTRRHSRSDLTVGSQSNEVSSTAKADFAPVYITLCTLANYPHLRGLQLAPTDHAWKWTLAATILAGFGFVAFRLAKTHF